MSRFGSELSFEVIGEGTRLGYWGVGVIVSIGWVLGVPLIISAFGGSAYEWSILVSSKGFILCIFALWGLVWMKGSNSRAIKSLGQNIGSKVASELEKSFMDNVAWRVALVADVVLYGGWLFYFDNPLQRWGVFPVLYNTVIWLLLSLVFVDLFAILFNIFLVSRNVGKHAEVDLLHPDKCGGMRLYSRHVLRSSAVYYIVLSIATFARSEFLQPTWILLEAIIAWVAGLVFVLACLYYVGLNTKLQKQKAFDSCFKQLRELGGLTATSTERAIKSLFLYRAVDQIERVKVWPLDVQLLRDFLLGSVVPVLMSVLLTRLLSLIGFL